MPTPIVLVGFGNQGKEHFDALKRNDAFDLACVVEPNENILIPDGIPRRKTVYDLTDIQAEAAIVATPPSLYVDIIPELFKNGLDVLLEKPFGISFDEALYLLQLAEQKKRLIIPAVQRRYHSTYMKLPEFYENAGTLQEALIHISITHKPTSWRADDTTRGAGALFDLGYHAIDLALGLFGDLKLIQAAFFGKDGEIYHDNLDFEADLLFENEHMAPIRIHIQRAAEEKREYVVLRGTNGRLICDRSQIKFVRKNSSHSKTLYQSDRDWDVAMQQQLDHFAHYIEEPERISRDELSIQSMEAAQAMRLIDLCYAYVK